MKSVGRDRDPHWHMDFRSTEGLPDIKVVRTHFFVNTVMATLLVVVLAFWAYDEYSVSKLDYQISRLQRLFEDGRKVNAEYLSLSKDFQGYSTSVDTLARFYEMPFDLVDVLADLIFTRPDTIRFKKIGYAVESGVGELVGKTVFEVKVVGSIKGTSEEALSMMDSYKETLRYLGSFNDRVHDVSVTSMDRDSLSELFNFTLEVYLTNEA